MSTPNRVNAYFITNQFYSYLGYHEGEFSSQSGESQLTQGAITYKSTRKYENKDINSKDYMREVRRTINNDMDSKSTLGAVYWTSFRSIYERKGGRKYLKADPFYDAWMCVRGETRDVFNCHMFYNLYPSVKHLIVDIRQRCNVQAGTIDVPRKNKDISR